MASLEEMLIQTDDTQYGKYLTFSLGTEIFGVEINFVTEIIGMQPITPLPETQEFMRGIINLRGKIVPVIDMRRKFNMESMEYGDRTCIIVIEINDTAAGMIVDSVSEVLMIPDEEISPPPGAGAGMQSNYITGVGRAGGSVQLLLSCEKLFQQDELDLFKI